MNLKEYQQLIDIRASLIKGMIDFMDEDTGYNQSHVDECGRILDDYLEAISIAENKETATGITKSTVQKLNELNEQSGEELIETDQREQICEMIILAGHLKGFNGADEDVTEDWREW